mmetsp:Transcript_49982/g.140080  ORF Transcript_49982/g.140080 Transcript_49982/m.140080 type:complete len:243 (+) Transcript_49982:192-920(+)
MVLPVDAVFFKRPENASSEFVALVEQTYDGHNTPPVIMQLVHQSAPWAVLPKLHDTDLQAANVDVAQRPRRQRLCRINGGGPAPTAGLFRFHRRPNELSQHLGSDAQQTPTRGCGAVQENATLLVVLLVLRVCLHGVSSLQRHSVVVHDPLEIHIAQQPWKVHHPRALGHSHVDVVRHDCLHSTVGFSTWSSVVASLILALGRPSRHASRSRENHDSHDAGTKRRRSVRAQRVSPRTPRRPS